jgi:hypothetical protein
MASNNSVRFSCTALAGSNKVGNIKRDENGYYPMVVGALNVYNSAGQFYVYEQAKELFQESSQLMRRVSKGALRGEYGHPKPTPGMSNDQFANRVMSIYEENTCCHHKEITLDFENVKDESGNPVIAIISKVCPSGPMGPALERSLQNKDENVCFSIRAFTDDFRDRGITKRVLKTIVTWDLVNEPGLAIANKFAAPALEAFAEEDGLLLSRGEIERGMSAPSVSGYASESCLLTGAELFRSMNWVTGNKTSNVVQRPNYLNW